MYCQRDGRWAGQLLGLGPDTIGAVGCYLTSDADLMTWIGHPFDPAQLNAQYRVQGIFVQGELLQDSAIHDAFPDIWTLEEVYHCESVPCDQSKLDNDDPSLYVVVELAGPGGLTHFSPVLNWRGWTIADTWTGTEMTIGQVGAMFGWGSDPAALVGKVMRYRFQGPAPQPPSPPPPPPQPPGTFQGTITAGGAHVRTLPGTDQPLVPQPGANPDVVDGGVVLNFDGWCHHSPHGGADVMPLDTAFTPPRPDDRWFRVAATGHWIASIGVDYQNGADPPSNLLVQDPNPVPAPAPQPQPPGTFQGTITAGGAHVRTLPGTDQPLVPQPGANPDTVDAGVVLDFDGWCHHAPHGGADVMPLDTAFTPPRPDDRWFRVAATGHWIASIGVDYQNGADPPGNFLAQDPNQGPAPAPWPAPTPGPVAFRGDVSQLAGRWIVVWQDVLALADFQRLRALGYDGIAVRAANGEGGAHDATFRQRWATMAPLAKQAGLRVAPWTYWYGPGDAGYTEPDETTYLLTCADNTVGHPASTDPDVKLWLIDFESKVTAGLAAALRSLRDRSGLSVVLVPYGDFVTVGEQLDLGALDAAVDGYAPQMYTGAWAGGAMTFAIAAAQWAASKRPIFPMGDAQDLAAIQDFLAQASNHGYTGTSTWRWGVLSDAALQAWAMPATPRPTPVPVPVPTLRSSPAPTTGTPS